MVAMDPNDPEQTAASFFSANLLTPIIVDDAGDADYGKYFLSHGPYRLDSLAPDEEPLFSTLVEAYDWCIQHPVLLSSFIGRCIAESVIKHVKSLNPDINV